MITSICILEKHILHGQRRSCDMCPLALAISEQFPKAIIFVDRETFTIRYTVIRMTICRRLPQEAKDFIFDFDRGFPVKSIGFEIDHEVIPEEIR